MSERMNKVKEGGISAWVRGSIHNKSIVYMLLVLLIAAGIFGLVNMNKDEFPTFELKQGLVAAVYPGADVHQVEEEVGKPLEKLLFSFSEVNRKSTKVVSKDGICYIYVDLTSPASKKDEVWSKIKLKINSFKQTLPPGVLAVVVMDDFSAITTVLIAMESEDKGWSEMKDYAEDLSDRLRTIPELANVKILGTQDEEIAVTMDMDRMSAYGISPTALMLEYQTSGLQALGGTFSTDYTVSPVHVLKTVSDEEELSNKIIFNAPSGEVLRLKDVAKVERRYKDPSSLVSYNGHTAVILSVEMRPDNNIVAFGRDVDKIIDGFMADAPDSVKLSRITDQPKVVGTSVWSFLRDLVISMLVVIAVMLLLFPMRSALIASSGVPVCTAIALALMYMFGICLNTVSLAALIVVLGMIVDDSVITMDGYMDKLGKGMPRLDAACASAQELFTPMFMATFAISAMFFPMTHIITGYLGDFVATFPWVIAFSLMTSLVYAVTVVPSLEVKYIRGNAPKKENFISRMQKRLFNGLQSGYEWMQDKCFSHPYITVLGGVGAVALGLFLFTRINLQLMPMAARPVFAVEIYLDPSADLQKTKQVSDSLSVLLRKDSRVTSVTEFIGTGTPRFHATYAPILPGRNVAQLIVNTKSAKDTESFLAENEDRYEYYFPEAVIHFKQMDYQGTSTPVEVRVSGADYDKIKSVSDEIKAFMMGVESIKWVHSDADWYAPSIALELDSDEASRLGVNRTLMNLSLTSLLNGVPVTSIREGDDVIPVNLYAENVTKQSSYDVIENALVPTSVPGVSVPVRQVSEMSPQWNPESLCRLDGEPSISIGADMKFGNSQPVAMRQIKKFVENDLVIPEGVEVTYGGLNGVNGQMGPEIALSFLAAVAVLFFFLVFHFKKVSLAVLTMVLSTLCLFGAFFGLWIFNLDFSMTAVLGLVSLVGIIVRNGIIMFEYAEELRFEKGIPVKEAAEEAGKRRMRPIFLTSATTALGVLPMVISADLLWMPMGVVICFGTLLSMVLITLIMPVSYWLIFKHSDGKVPQMPDSDDSGSTVVDDMDEDSVSYNVEADNYNVGADNGGNLVKSLTVTVLTVSLLVAPGIAPILSAQSSISAQIGNSSQPSTSAQIGNSSQSSTSVQIGNSSQPSTSAQLVNSSQPSTSAQVGNSSQPSNHTKVGNSSREETALSVQSRTITLEDCKAMALEHNSSVRNSALDVKAAQLQKQEAFAEYFPRVSASMFGYYSLNPLIDIDVRDVLGNNDFANNIQHVVESYGSMYGISTSYTTMKQGYSASLTALQPIYAGGRIVAGNALAKLGIEAAQLQNGIQVRKTTAEVENLWWQIAGLEEKLSTLESLEAILDTLNITVSEAIKAGLAAETDILQIDLKRSELNAGKKQIISGIRLLKVNLFNVVGQRYALYEAVSSEDRPFIDDIVLDCTAGEVMSPEKYYREAGDVVSNMEESELLDLQVRAGELEKRMAIGGALPQVAVGVTSGYSNLMDKGRINAIALATVKIPISDWGKAARKAQRIETKVQKAKNDREFLTEQLNLQVSKLWLDLITAYDQWQVALEADDIAGRLFEVAESNYRAGMISIQELLQAESSMMDARSTASDRLIDYRNAIRAYTEL